MDIESIARQLFSQVEQNFQKYGFLSPVTLFIIQNQIVMLPVELIELFIKDKDKYVEAVRYLVKENPPDAVVIISEVWYLDNIKDGKIEQPSKSQNRKEAVFLTVDSKNKQITYINQIKDKKLTAWREFGIYDKLNHTAGNIQTMAGNFTDFYGTGANLTVPVEMMEKPKGEVKDVPKIDG